MAAGKHREGIIKTAAMLFRRQGYAATGLNELIEQSGAPKGSVYHYFPRGKAQIAAAAVAFSGSKLTATLEHLASQASSAADLIAGYADLLAGWMEKSGFSAGCPIATVVLETVPAEPEITAAGQAAFVAWIGIISKALQRDGFEPIAAQRLAGFAVSALEGSLIRARAEYSAAPIVEAASELALIMRRTD